METNQKETLTQLEKLTAFVDANFPDAKIRVKEFKNLKKVTLNLERAIDIDLIFHFMVYGMHSLKRSGAGVSITFYMDTNYPKGSIEGACQALSDFIEDKKFKFSIEGTGGDSIRTQADGNFKELHHAVAISFLQHFPLEKVFIAALQKSNRAKEVLIHELLKE